MEPYYLRLRDETKEEALELAKRFTEIGYSLIGTKHTAAYFEKNGLVVETVAKISEEAAEKNVVDLIRDGKTQVVVNTIDKDREMLLKTVSSSEEKQLNMVFHCLLL